MAYEANRSDDKELEKERNNANNTKNLRNAADVAIASGHPVAAAVGAGVKVADKVTGGKATELAGKAMTTAGKISPMGRKMQKASNQLSESGISDAAGSIAAKKNAMSGQSVPGKNESSPGNALEKKGGGQNSSLSSNEKEKDNKNPLKNNKKEKKNSDEQSETKDAKGKTLINAFLSLGVLNTILIMTLPLLIVIFWVVVIFSSVTGIFGNFDDAFGISATVGEDTGGIEYEVGEKEKQDLYDRINAVVKKYEQEGKLLDPLKITATFHILRSNNGEIEYNDFTTPKIEEIALAFYDEAGIYSDDVFEKNMIQTIIPKYVSDTTEAVRKDIVEQINQYIEDYYSLIGKEEEATCSNESGTCTYSIDKGYYYLDLTGEKVNGQGYASEKIRPSNIYVRLMDCNGKALDEDLVPFEKFVLGVSYATLDNPTEAAFKAETVGVRSYMLGVHKATKTAIRNSSGRLQYTQRASWKTLQEEDGHWIMQASSCSNEPLYYCNPDKGCSTDSKGNIVSGPTSSGTYKKGALSKDSPLRSYALETEGEVLKRANGYIMVLPIYQIALSYLAEKELDYKQILISFYGGEKSDLSISKNSCSNSLTSKECVSTGSFSKWKQKGSSWSNIQMGRSGKTIGDIGCLVTSVAMQIAKSGVKTNIANFNPGTFVQFLNKNGGFDSVGNFVWATATKAAPSFQYVGQVGVSGMTKEQKLAKIKELVNNKGIYVVAEVKGNTGQHWVAIDSVTGSNINMMDPGSNATNMWSQYNWKNTSILAYYRVS